MTDTAPKDRIIIFDTTLRDGEQSPGCSMNLEEKLRVARLLDQMGVDVIEAGFPIASPGDFEAVQAIAGSIKNAVVCGLARAKPADIDVAGEALKPAEKRRIHTFISTSDIHMRYQLQMPPEAVLESVKESVTRARSHTDNVEWSAMDATRSEIDFLCQCVEAAIACGATTINLPDTVGFATPDEMAAIITNIRNRVPNIDKAVLSMHCHNDLGLAVANSLAGVKAGARQIECTINGIGERAGNAALEEVVMALKVRGDVMPFETGVDATMITKASRTLSSITGFNVQPNKAIVGANAFAHESGIHQDGVLKHAGTYEIMRPESVGLTKSNLVMGKHSGRHALKAKLEDMGYDLGDNAFQDLFQRFKNLADRKKTIYDEDLVSLLEDESSHDRDRVKFVSLHVSAGSKGPQIADLSLNVDGVEQASIARGNGPVDAIFNAIRDLVPHSDSVLQLYQVHAVTGGTDAQAEVTVRLEEDGRTVTGQAADADTLVASCRAYIHALNRLMLKRERPKTGMHP
jgi:2-isopropylmalate synthase